MKNREPVKKKGNVVFFPHLDKRLTEKGLDCLQDKKYMEAISYLEDARELDPLNDNILIGLVLAYFESAQFQDAKVLAKDMLLKGIGDYAQMVELYLTILLQLHEHTEIISTIEALIEEKEIPPEKYEHLLTILEFSKRMAEKDQSLEESSEIKDGQSEKIQNEELDLFALTDPKEQMLLVSKLADRNIRPYMQAIKTYLRSEQGHPFFKTMLLNLLRDQEYDQEVVVHKFNLEREFIPVDLPEIESQAKMGAVLEGLKRNLESSNPVLLENIKNLVERHFLIVYPFSLEPVNASAWAAGFHLIALKYHGIKSKISDFAVQYSCSGKDIETAIALIEKLEQISYPII